MLYMQYGFITICSYTIGAQEKELIFICNTFGMPKKKCQQGNKHNEACRSESK